MMSTASNAHDTNNMDDIPDQVSPLTSDADSDGDDLVSKHARTSNEVAENDRKLLVEEDEREKLLSSGDSRQASRGFFSKRYKDERSGAGDKRPTLKRHRQSRKRRRDAAGGSQDEAGELMYEMEEGGPGSDISSRASSSSAEIDKLNLGQSSIHKVRMLSLRRVIRAADDAPSGSLLFGL